MVIQGRCTGCDLTDVSALFTPWIAENGLSRPVFSREAAARSLELAATAYDLWLDSWREAGWYDFSFQVDNTLLTGPAVSGGAGGTLSEAVSGYFQRLARSRIRRQNPITQLRGALRQREGSDTCKAVVMAHHAPDGRYVIAIGFMGTGKRVADWLSNIRLSQEDGAHRGFLQLTREFESRCGEICFPETARELGVDKLTLSDIFDACRRPNSRFHIWMAGHSQGGAVMQLTALREIGKGLLRQNLTGYSFASPSVLYENPGLDLTGFPLFHIINGDDTIPRVGARLHVGQCLVILPDEKMRAACYQPAWEEPAFRATLALLQRIHSCEDSMLMIEALLSSLEDLSDEDSVAVLTGILGKLLPDKLVGLLGGRLDVGLRMLIAKAEQGYRAASGREEIPQAQLTILKKRISHLMALYGARPFTRALLQALRYPHRLRSAGTNRAAAYQYIVNERIPALQRRVWCAPAIASAVPRRPAGRRATPDNRFALHSAARGRRARRSS